jgi:hypothetical protein
MSRAVRIIASIPALADDFGVNFAASSLKYTLQGIVYAVGILVTYSPCALHIYNNIPYCLKCLNKFALCSDALHRQDQQLIRIVYDQWMRIIVGMV